MIHSHAHGCEAFRSGSYAGPEIPNVPVRSNASTSIPADRAGNYHCRVRNARGTTAPMTGSP